jgi:hypothetical protein
MEISQAELERRLNSSKNLANVIQKPPAQKSVVTPKETPKHIDSTTRTVAAILANSGDKQTAKDLGLSSTQIKSAQNSSKIQNKVSAGTERVRELALDKLMSALGLMTEEKFENANLRELSGVARDMSRVVESTTEKVVQDSRLQIIIQAPPQKTEDYYKTLDV